MRPATAHEPTQSRTDSVRGPAQAVGCCARGFRSAKHLRRLDSDAHWLAPVDIGHGSLERLLASRLPAPKAVESAGPRSCRTHRALRLGVYFA